MNKKILNKRKIILLFLSAIVILLFTLKNSFADSNIYEINNVDELIKAAELSRQSGHQNDTYILNNDIIISEEDQEKINESDFKHISFGSSDYPFKGTFDGKGHSISNLKYQSSLEPKSDTGLFSYTSTGAVIKDLTILNAEIQADCRGGIISGYSEGTTFENITIKDSHLFVAATNNVLNIITDGGIRGGAIVGEAKDCILYNCESVNNRVNTNNTLGVAALAGKGLYLGGLVGTSISTEIEYSRVEGGLIKNYYDVAVGALGGNTLYVGGIVAQMNENSKVIDSYSTAELNFYCATYVSVGAGNTGHIGGIAGAMFGNDNEIIRCIYAGKASSEQYNAVLVIPIIQKNVNISGISDVYEGGIVENTYFKPSLNPDVEMKVLGNDESTDTYGSLNDEIFINKEFWQFQNYDMHGNIERNTSYSNSHINKWIFDSDKEILIHGQSIAATLNFKGAGKVTIGKTNLVNSETSTENPYSFAVQGIKQNETKATINAIENEGYKFISWYRIKNSIIDKLDENYDYFEQILKNNVSISNEKIIENISINDNDLFIAYYQAQVLFYDIKGELIDKNTGNSIAEPTLEDWYNYNDKLNCVDPVNGPKSPNAKLIGWTTIKSKEEGGAYSSITSPELISLKNNNAFYENGDRITKSMKLYPVYADLISNINTVFEGNEHDNIDDASRREGVGNTSVSLNDNNNIVINVDGINVDGTFPEGYKFIGWFDENNVKITNESSFELKNINLMQQHTYTAKFEYLVEYYVRAYGQHNGSAFTESELFASKYQKYNSDFENIAGPGYIKEYITHWGIEHVNHGSKDDDTDEYKNKIFEPLKVYSHNYIDSTNNETFYQAYVTTDYPGSGTISDEQSITGGVFRFTPTNDRYHLLFWTLERSNEGWTYVKNPMNTGILDPSIQYKGMAMVTSDIIFHKKEGNDLILTRRYNDKLFLSKDTSYIYKYPFMLQDDEVNADPEDGNLGELDNTIILQASPRSDEMKIDGYAFLGWISSLDVEKDSAEWNYIYDVENDLYCTSDISKVIPYLLADDTIVTNVMDVYPVYAKFNVETSTDINLKYSQNINIPSNPNYEIIESQEQIGIATVVLEPDLNTFIMGNDGEKYLLESLVLVNEDGTEDIIELDENNIYKYSIEAGKDYKFMAKYKTNVLIYHLNDSDTKIETRSRGEKIGLMPKPTYQISELIEKYIFMGWSNKEPENMRYYQIDFISELETISIKNNTDIISDSMNLWPVYLKMQIEINSNIDDYIKNQGFELNAIRYITRPDLDKSQLNAKEDIDNYQFIGWYKNYKSDKDKGELITNNNTLILQKTENVQNDTYTAVYAKSYKIKYYNAEGSIIYTANVRKDENRTFVTEVIDGNENKVVTPIDYEAYKKIQESLKANQIFLNWQWKKEDGSTYQWDEFYDKNITQDMNLYPIIRVITVKDSDGIDLDVIGTNEKDPDIVLGSDSKIIYAYLNIDYYKPNITIHVEDIFYGDLGEYKIDYAKDMEVVLNNINNITEESLANGITNEEGNVTIDLVGEITINIESNEEKKDDIFIFEVSDEEGNLKSEILLPVGESKTIELQYGNYMITKKDSWSWRYINQYYKEVKVNNNNNKMTISFKESVGIPKWFDSMIYKENEYNK